MLVSFENLNFGDSEETVKGKARENGYIFCRLDAVALHCVKLCEEHSLWIIKCQADAGPDPKIHFTDHDQAKKLYDVLVEGLKDSVSFKEIDVLKYGAL